ncbi:MAG: cation:proton antiporter [Thermoplasmatales archaeon]|nr:MAG: cation:proton antiporter [Thermoplasmatales archaeon]
MLAVALIFARGLGFLINKLKQPAVIGEIIAGIILGLIIILFFSGQKFYFSNYVITPPELSFHSPEFNLLAEIGILFLLFVSGLETSISRLKKTGKTSTIIAIGGVLIPLLLGFFSGLLIGLPIAESIVIGLVLTATSVGVTVRTLMDLNVLDSKVGATVLGAAVIDDIIGIILLALVLGIESINEALIIVVKIAIFFLVFLYFALKLIDKVLDLGEKIHLPKAFLSISIAILLIYSFFAEKAGISGIIGAFIAGILIGTNVRSSKIEDDIKAIGYGFFIPIFFVWTGTLLWEKGTMWDINSISLILILTTVLLVIGITGKIIGCGLSAKISGMSNMESIQIGVAMIPRMELALIIVAAAINNDFIPKDFAQEILAATILLTIITTLLTPILIKATFKNNN